MAHHTNVCWFLKPPLVHVILGRHGDLIQMLPAWCELHRRTGQRTIVVVSEDYAATLDGASYIEPHPVPFDYTDVPKARAYAEATWGGCVVLPWWLDTKPVPPGYHGPTKLTCNGRSFSIDRRRWPSYAHSLWERAGFKAERDMLNLPLVFDRRSPEREASLLAAVRRTRPLLLYNFTGVSSPFGYVPELWPLLQRAAKTFTLVDLGTIKAARIYDLLGLYDVAAGLLTCDTATLHLAPASPVPYIAFTQNGWLGSTPKGNCKLVVRYADTLRRLPDVRAVLENWASAHATTPAMLVPAT